jgi:hypothetical protein
MQQHFGSGRMWLMRGQDLLEQEAKSFPNGKHDDTLDALWMAMYKCFRPTHGMEEYHGDPLERVTRHEPASWMAR